ncbi:MAG: alpha/beta hydrolase [Alphaproteobacteria bacterium]|nr:alpha/beta hydrolase [Alphaproteobacteria bacterium]
MPEVKVDGQTVAYDRIDTAPPWRRSSTAIMFIHGVGADRDIWGDWLPHLADRYTILRLDLPGHGKSQAWNPSVPLGYEFYMNLIRAVIDGERIESLILIGESMGGTIALHAASDMPECVRAVATCSTAHRGGTLRNIRPWREIMEEDGMAAWSEHMLEKRSLPGAVEAPVQDWFHGAQCQADGESILAMADVLVRSDLTDRLDRITAPVLLMQPDSSPFIPLEVPVELKELLPDGRLRVIPSARHGIACSHAYECALEARAFFEERVEG